MPLAAPFRAVRVVLVACLGFGGAAPARATDRAVAAEALPDTNAAVNRASAHLPDAVTDDWATPTELRARGAGDCEDFAIAKYFALLAQGLPPSRLRLAYVRLQLGGGAVWQPHVVLVVLPSDDAPIDTAEVLDSVLDDVRPLARRPDLDVRMSFNADGLWPGLARGPAARPPAQLRRWARVLALAAAGAP